MTVCSLKTAHESYMNKTLHYHTSLGKNNKSTYISKRINCVNLINN